MRVHTQHNAIPENVKALCACCGWRRRDGRNVYCRSCRKSAGPCEAEPPPPPHPSELELQRLRTKTTVDYAGRVFEVKP
jgi:hypothetical protein